MPDRKIDAISILENIPEPLLLVGLDRTIIWANDFFMKLAGKKERELLGKKCFEIGVTDFCAINCPENDGTDPETTTYKRVRISGDMNAKDYWLVRSPFYANGKLEGHLKSFRDLSFFEEIAPEQRVKGSCEGSESNFPVSEPSYYIVETRSQDCSTFEEIVGRSSVMCNICSKLKAVAVTDATVLLTGESGTGKELAARGIHKHSMRNAKPFISVNCAAISDQLLESELFGHVRGAFTGAIRDRQGRFELSHGGTLFLDEIGDMSPSLQAKILRAIEEKTVQPLGSEKELKVDVRIIAATNRNLSDGVRKGTFREDLFYRLNVFPVEIPPLRAHKEDIPFLLNYFVAKYVGTHFRGKANEFNGFSERAMSAIVSYDWPGNIRELENAIEYAMVSTDSGRIEIRFLPPAVTMISENDCKQTASDSSEKKSENERDCIQKALDRNKWSVSKTAQSLNMSRTTLWRKMKMHRLGK